MRGDKARDLPNARPIIFDFCEDFAGGDALSANIDRRQILFTA